MTMAIRVQVVGTFAGGQLSPIPTRIGVIVSGEALTIGRSPRRGLSLLIVSPTVSKEHARLEPAEDDAWRLTDLYSDNGVYSYPDLQRHQSLTIRGETQVLIGGFVVSFTPS